MVVYVDPAVHQFRGMLMCHMWADTHEELLAMVDAIGVARRWIQHPPHASWVHFDISKGKRAIAVRLGAVETDRYGPVEHVCRQRVASGVPSLVELGRARLASIAAARARQAAQDPEPDLFAAEAAAG